jgi:thiol-disulfide isomerase/thioredoxin/sugar lactone lactonase YvrE
MKRILLVALAAALIAGGLLAGRSRAQPTNASAFPPGLTWFNVARPLDWPALKDRAVLLDFFTPGCINCIHMLPVEQQLARKFGPRLVIIGVDSPKFAASKTRAGLEAFIQRYSIEHPIVLDPDMQIWDAWGVQAWPTLVLVGPDGRQRQQFIGERSYDQLAAPIAAALADAPPANQLPTLPLRPEAFRARALATPAGIAVSPTLVAIADTGHNRIVLASHAGRLVAIVGTGCAGGRDGDYAHATFDRPHGLTFHDGALYVADTGGQRLRRINLATRTVTTIAGSGQRAFASAGSGTAALATPLNSPWDVAWHGGMLYVSMAGDHQIWRYDPTTARIGPWAGTGMEGLVDGARSAAQFAQPSALDAHGDALYDADPESSSIRAIALPGGAVTTLVGRGLFDFGLRNGAADTALLQHAEGLTWHAGTLYVADTYNDALRALDLANRRVTTVAALIDQPLAVAALAPDALLVAEGGANRIDLVHLPDGKVTPWPVAGLSAPATACTK